MTPLSAPMSRLVLPSGSSISSSTREYLACFRTERRNSVTAHLDLDSSMRLGCLRCRDGDGDRELEVTEGNIRTGQGSEQPSEGNAIDHARESPSRAIHGGRNGQRHRHPTEPADHREFG